MRNVRNFGLLFMGFAIGLWLWEAPTFINQSKAIRMESYVPIRRLSHAKSTGESMDRSAITVLATSLITIGAVVGRCKIARSAVLEKDSAGRFRFAGSEGSKEKGSSQLVFADEPGVSQPWGFYDPLNFCNSQLMTFPGEGDPTGFYHLRNAELKHGRFAMMAATGSLFACYVKFPGFENVPSGLAALSDTKGSDGAGLLFCAIAAHEIMTWNQDEEPSSYDGLRNQTPELVTKELNNGRLAMFAFAGQIAAEMLTGQDPAQQFASWAYSYPKFV
ncbi:FCPE [Symbiodinium pilosum]|uniref:FCPE protein n=1 Tax=Symbiodinium pilosum TaxID=2952 RepID=A0A812WD76_SYMPI|nr:FCPE [Symbiodinium pilosum]